MIQEFFMFVLCWYCGAKFGLAAPRQSSARRCSTEPWYCGATISRGRRYELALQCHDRGTMPFVMWCCSFVKWHCSINS
ncbi:hypothetical protein PanWU01x14_157650 [Parasponia andersonii]|uniref:Secreted protein n=1 Tax=Parasponia andersonii TaxID=3476 RepID=A0A2P5CFB4_PARAD|nr:hypothetical protein PanWU01x14_157650 [Parasponia andersonii]